MKYLRKRQDTYDEQESIKKRKKELSDRICVLEFLTGVDEQIEECKNELNKLTKETYRDPLSLPLELVYIIWNTLDHWKDVIRCAGVCKSWRRFAFLHMPRAAKIYTPEVSFKFVYEVDRFRKIFTDEQWTYHIFNQYAFMNSSMYFLCRPISEKWKVLMNNQKRLTIDVAYYEPKNNVSLHINRCETLMVHRFSESKKWHPHFSGFVSEVKCLIITKCHFMQFDLSRFQSLEQVFFIQCGSHMNNRPAHILLPEHNKVQVFMWNCMVDRQLKITTWNYVNNTPAEVQQSYELYRITKQLVMLVSKSDHIQLFNNVEDPVASLYLKSYLERCLY